MAYDLFDTSRLNIKPISERVHDVDISVMMQTDSDIEHADLAEYDEIAESMIQARNKNATVLMMYGAHVIRTGNSLYMIEMMKRGLITHFATNGAGAIHDFEFSMIGATCESVGKYISAGQFGLWKETGLLNEAVIEGNRLGLGFGESVGKYIWENDFQHREKSVLAMGYYLNVPCTVHVGIGNDIVHEHPNCDGAVIGETSYRDFLIYTNSVSNLENGVFLNFGSAVTGPEVYLKALAMARNVAHQDGKRISNFTTAVFDVQAISGDIATEPEKSNQLYYFRPWKTILARTVADGGRSFYIQGKHQETIPNLFERIIKRGDKI